MDEHKSPDSPASTKPAGTWPLAGGLGILAGAALAYYIGLYGGGSGAPEMFGGSLLAVFAGWSGAFAGGVYDWFRHRRSPFEPLLPGDSFGWYYRKRYWLRLSCTFAFGWLAFVGLAVGLAFVIGAKAEAEVFFTRPGLLLVLIFVAVFGVEGALVGGLVDLVRRVRGGGR
ncbi:MAG: hypothetical protein HZC51_04810 [Nitrospirae bacterium]|nr:hypothetical protein [Nitrospirota bacterium]